MIDSRIFSQGVRWRGDWPVAGSMLAGWADQQASRNLHADTIRDRLLVVRRFQRFTNDWPWVWRPVDVEEFTAELRGAGRSLSTMRAYQGGLRQFLDYVTDPRYEWTAACERLFGTHPTQVCFEWNTAVHAADYEGRPGRRALTKVELQRLFDHADEQVTAARASGRKVGSAGTATTPPSNDKADAPAAATKASSPASPQPANRPAWHAAGSPSMCAAAGAAAKHRWDGR